jgi:ankyrin repeat protein
MSWQQAAETGEYTVLEGIVNAQADVETLVDEETGAKPLHYGAKGGNVRVVKFLLYKRAFVDSTDRFGRTPLYLAVLYQHVEVVQVLLNEKANPNIICRCGTSCVSKAAENGDIGILDLLLESGASWKTRNMDGETPKDLAVRNGHQIARSRFELYEIDRLRSFLKSTKNGAVGEMEKLIKNGVDPNARDAAGNLALDLAAQTGQIEAARFLLYDTNISAAPTSVRARVENARAITPLHWAAKYGHDAVVELLLEAGARVDAPDRDGMTPLHRAAEKGAERAVKAMLKHGADPTVVGVNGATPLRLATTQGRVAVVRLLTDASRSYKKS